VHNGDLHNLYSSNISRVMKSRMGEMRYAYKILLRVPERKRPLGRDRNI